MKVVQINAVYRIGSTGRNLSELNDKFVERGHEVYNFYSVKSHDSDNYNLIGSKFDHKLHALCSRVFGLQGYFSYIATKHLIRKIDKINPDVVLLHNFHSNYINFPILLSHLAKNDIPTVVVLHDCWFFTGHCCHYTEIGCNKWQTECHHCQLIHTNNKSLFFDNSRKIFRDKKHLFSAIPRLAVVGVSDWITHEAQQSPIFRQAKRFERIYNWIDLTRFYPRDTSKLKARLGLREDAFVALGISMSWSYRKGLSHYIEVAKALPDIHIVMVGQMPHMELPSNVRVVPPTSSVDELAEYYSLADVLFNFSIQETFGKVAAEALACGTPLVVNNATANPEIPGECGFVVDCNHTQQIADAVCCIRSKGKKSLQDACVKRAQTLFDKKTNLEQYLRLFEQLNR